MIRWWIRLACYGFTQWKRLIIIILLMCASIGFGLLKPWPIKWIIDHVLQDQPWPESLKQFSQLAPQSLLVILTISTLVIFLGGWLARAVQNYLKAGAGNRMIHALGADVFNHLQHLSIQFHGKNRIGDLSKRITTDCSCVRQLMLNVFLPGLTAVISLIAMLVVLSRLDPTLALIAVALTPLLGVCIWFFARPMAKRTSLQYELQGDIMAKAEQTLTTIPLVRTSTAEYLEDTDFTKLWTEGDKAYLGVVSSELQFKVSTGTITAIGTALVMAIGGTHVLDGTLTIGGLLVFLSYLTSLYSPLETLAYLSTGLAAASAGSKRVFEIMDAPQTVQNSPNARPFPKSTRTLIQFDDVNFRYEEKTPVLKNISLKITSGETVALVGLSGTGKTTLATLIPRFYDPQSGEIRINGIDIKSIDLADLRDQFSIVLQDPFILPISIAQNIAYGQTNASKEDIARAASAANADEFIENLPQGYDTVVGQNGETLSGGQRQRIAIARALLKNAPILILDEPTAALDSKTEAEVVSAINRLMENRTTLIIAHRLSTIKAASRIIVMDQGRIVESGTHAELLKLKGHYARLCALQFEGGRS